MRRARPALGLVLVAALAGACAADGEEAASTTSGTSEPVLSESSGTDPEAGDDDGGDDRDASDAPFGAALVAAVPATPGTATTFSVVDATMTETFDGAPATPTPWRSPSWDVTVHSRDRDTWDELESMRAAHGADCSGPPHHHEMSTYAGAVFQCRDHLMTALNATGYGVIYLTPAALVDFDAGPATIRLDASTAVTSDRDWWDLWITPYEDHLQLPLNDGLPDLAGLPRRGIRIRLNTQDQRFEASVIEDGQEIDLPVASAQSYREVFEPDAARRDTFEANISSGHLRFGMPDYDLWWVDTELPELGWSTGVVQLGHHSYNPEKAHSPDDATANTWHWDNMTIHPARPFTILPDETGAVGGGDTVSRLRFASPSPADAHLRFAGVGDVIQFSADGGDTWVDAERQWSDDPGADEHFHSYWTPIPAGVDEILVRGEDWWGGDWRVRDASVFSLTPPE